MTYPHIVTYYAADSTEPWTYSWVAFTGEEIESLLSRTSLSPEQPVFPMDQQLMPALYDRLTAASDSAEGLDLPLKAIMYEFLRFCCVPLRRRRTVQGSRGPKACMLRNVCISCMPITVKISL